MNALSALGSVWGFEVFKSQALEGTKKPWHWADERTLLVSPTFYEALCRQIGDAADNALKSVPISGRIVT